MTEFFFKGLPDSLGSIEKLQAPDSTTRQAILRSKLRAGLNQWALAKMGPGRDLLLEEGLRLFLTLLLVQFAERPTMTFEDAVASTPFPVPLTPRRKRTPFRANVHPADLLNEYDRLLPVVQELKLKAKAVRNKAVAANVFVEDARLAGTTLDEARKFVYMRASEIAFTYLARKYKLGIGGEGLRKVLGRLNSTARQGRLFEQVRRSIERRCGISLPRPEQPA